MNPVQTLEENVIRIGSIVEGEYFLGERKKIEEGGRWKVDRVYERNLGVERYHIREDYHLSSSANTISPDSFIGRALMGQSAGSLVYVSMGSTSDGIKVDFKIKITKILKGDAVPTVT